MQYSRCTHAYVHLNTSTGFSVHLCWLNSKGSTKSSVLGQTKSLPRVQRKKVWSTPAYLVISIHIKAAASCLDNNEYVMSNFNNGQYADINNKATQTQAQV